MKFWNQESTLKSISQCKCPRCHTGDMFENGTLSRPYSLFKMKAKCDNCHQPFEPEPGFYFGAMFISYAFNTALFITVWVLMNMLHPEYSLLTLLITIGIAAILALPLIFRWSRSIWIAIFIPFEKGIRASKH
ncbi:DUF983 domain-containing protein [Algoriphagus vanfongensis]|uniref:DUF983 domain-containing protein n=1 Tax=Algoriphagus vanfongensis TaxID=426371 RepID=UPI000A05A012|nr:DUF983 domain-containing protein [Algoriphagus vanfongensis]